MKKTISKIYFLILIFIFLFNINVVNGAAGDVISTVEIDNTTTNGPTLSGSDYFGWSVANIGDLNNDGVQDLAVGAPFDDLGGSNQGAVHILFMNTDGSIDSTVEINSVNTSGLAVTDSNDYFGVSIANIGDLDGDGVQDLVVGESGNDASVARSGSIHVLFMNTDGSVKTSVEIDDSTTNGPSLISFDEFGASVANIGDLNNDGVQDLAVGATGDDGAYGDAGAVYILFMNTDGSIDSTLIIDSYAIDSLNLGTVLGGGDRFGRSVANIGDLDGDGVQDLAVGANEDDNGGSNRGAIYILFMNTNGTVDSISKIDSLTNNGPVLSNSDQLGWSVANIGDLDGDGVQDLVVGGKYDDEGGTDRGNVHILFMNTDGSIDSTVEINSSTVNGPTLSNTDYFGSSVTSIDDLDGDGVQDLTVGAPYNDEGIYIDSGAVHIIYLEGPPDNTAPTVSVTNPGDSEYVSGTINITANASDNVEVLGVQFYINDVAEGSEDTSSPYSISWDSTVVSDGSYTVKAVARDAANNIATSTTVTFNVLNTSSSISEISATTTQNTATITWNTDQQSSSKVNFGTSQSLRENTSETNTSPRVTSHSVVLSDLVSCTKYYYQVQSTNSALTTATSSISSFKTLCENYQEVVDINTDLESEDIDVSSGGSLILDDITLDIPSDVTSTSSVLTFQVVKLNSEIFFTTVGTPDSKNRAGSDVFNLKSLSNSTTTVSSFDENITITISYTDSEISGIIESTLEIYRYDGSSWNSLSNCLVDANANTVTCETANFSDFALFGDEIVTSSNGSIISGRARTFGCKDENALNYNQFSTHRQELCEYDNTNSTQKSSLTNEQILLIIQLLEKLDVDKNIINQIKVLANSIDRITFTKNLQLGDIDEDVRLLQRYLNNTGYTVSESGPGSSGSETNIFGPLTQQAVIRFQRDNNITPAVGYFGPITRSFINK